MKNIPLFQHSRHIAQSALDLLFPPVCTICKQVGAVLCPSCLNSIPRIHSSFCMRCGSLHIQNGVCIDCTYHPLRLNGLRATSVYQDPLRSCIHALKYEGNIRLAEPLGVLLAETYTIHAFHADVLVPMPLHADRQRERGYNQGQLLAEVCAKYVHVPVNANIVRRHRATVAQASLKAAERQHNVAGAFLCSPEFTTGALMGRTIVIIDDVCTTGATLEACAAPLFAAGAQAVWGLVLARPL